MKYHYTNAQNQPVGPVELAELSRLASQGLIDDDTPVIADGGQTWSTYGAVRSGAATSAAAEAVAAGVGRATSALRSFSWGSLIYGLLLALLGWLSLPWTVLSSAARELAVWGRERTLPLAGSDVPVLTFGVVVLRNATLVLAAFFTVLFAILSLTGRGPFYFSFDRYNWQAQPALVGFFGGLLAGYFAQVAIALSFELTSLGVRMANDLKALAKR